MRLTVLHGCGAGDAIGRSRGERVSSPAVPSWHVRLLYASSILRRIAFAISKFVVFSEYMFFS